MKIERINKGSWGKIRAFFDLRTEEGFVIKGFKIIEGINGLFVGYPSQKGQDEEYYDNVYADKDLKDELTQIALKEYGSEIMGVDKEIIEKTEKAEENKNIEMSEPFSDDDIPF